MTDRIGWQRGDVIQTLSIHKPLLESWNHKNDPDQIRLRAYLDRIQNKLADALSAVGDAPLFLHLDVARDVPDTFTLLKHHDVENYASPIVYRLGARRFVLVTVTKRVGKVSFLQIGRAEQLTQFHPHGQWRQFTFPPFPAANVTNWKSGLRTALANHVSEPLPRVGPVTVRLVWRCSPRRNWLWLWKPTGDAMGPVLGEPFANRPYYPNDDRIVALELSWLSETGLKPCLQAGLWWREAIPEDTLPVYLVNDPKRVDIDTMRLDIPTPGAATAIGSSEKAIGSDTRPIAGRQPVVVDTDDALHSFHSDGQGWIYNDFAGHGANGRFYNMLHRAECRWLKRANINVPKYFFADLGLAIEWLEENRGIEGVQWKRCESCMK